MDKRIIQFEGGDAGGLPAGLKFCAINVDIKTGQEDFREVRECLPNLPCDMSIVEILALIRASKLYPICVEPQSDEDESCRSFVGSLEEFLEAAKAIEARAVFLATLKMEESDFTYSGEDMAQDDVYAGTQVPGDQTIDLRVVDPNLKEFEVHMGKECVFELTARGSVASLSYRIEERWWQSFAEQQQRAIDRADANIESFQEECAAKREREVDAILKECRSLLDDADFCRLKTQRAMRDYAIENYPKLQAVEDDRLRYWIQRLSDKVKRKTKR